MKIDYVAVERSVCIVGPGGSRQHTHFASDRWDIALIDFQRFEIRAKGDSTIIAGFPFSKSDFYHPAKEQQLTDLSSLEDEQGSDDDTLLEVPQKRGFARKK